MIQATIPPELDAYVMWVCLAILRAGSRARAMRSWGPN